MSNYCDYYGELIPDDGLINDFDLDMRLRNQEIIDDLLNHSVNRCMLFGFNYPG